MTKLHEIYKCNVCGNMVEVVDPNAGTLVCCDQNMEKLEEQTADAANEKHVPVIEKKDNGYQVTVGTTLHPMEEKHWIMWIELLADGVSYKKFLNPGDKPQAFFCIKDAKEISAREYCNIHGLWLGE